MIESATGIILRTRPLTETSLIVHWLTRESGRVATVAKGARRSKSPFLGKLDLFYLADFSFGRSRSSELHTLREVILRDTHAPLRCDILKLRQAAYAAALIEQATEAETPLPGLFELLRELVEHLCRHSPAPQTVFAFELKLLREIGLFPDWSKSDLTAGTKKTATALAGNDWPSLSRLKPSLAQCVELRRYLHGFLIFHLGCLPKGRAAALADAV
jgi:DNA repair protein RecO (recombination protein O)